LAGASADGGALTTAGVSLPYAWTLVAGLLVLLFALLIGVEQRDLAARQ